MIANQLRTTYAALVTGAVTTQDVATNLPLLTRQANYLYQRWSGFRTASSWGAAKYGSKTKAKSPDKEECMVTIVHSIIIVEGF